MAGVSLAGLIISGFANRTERELSPENSRIPPHLMIRPAFLTSALLVICFETAWALDNNALSVKVGEADLTPEVRLDYVSDSNVSRASEDEISATGFIVSPQALLLADRRLLSLSLGYAGSYALFSEDELDYDDHALTAGIRAEFSSRHRVSSELAIIKNHDELDEGEDSIRNEKQLEHLTIDLNTEYVFGARAAAGNIVAGIDITDKSFLNVDLDNNDYTDFAPYGRFSYRLSADTRTFAEVRFRDLDFGDDFRDRTELVTSFGLSFSETGATGGEAKVGFTSANYDAENRDDTTLLSAAINLFYEPSGISRFVLFFQRQLDNEDAINSGDALSDTIEDDFSLLWTYNWSGFVTTRATLGAENLTRDCPLQGYLTTFGGFEIGLKPRRWLEFGTGIEFSQRSGDDCSIAADNAGNSLDYDRQIINVFARATL